MFYKSLIAIIVCVMINQVIMAQTDTSTNSNSLRVTGKTTTDSLTIINIVSGTINDSLLTIDPLTGNVHQRKASSLQGTTGYLPRFTDPANLSNSILYDNGTAIGIGTKETGAYKLTVEGTIGARKLKVTQSPGWADYVFKKGYILRPLSEIAKFVKINGHLPEVPSATDIEKDGIDLGDNQVLLLKKIEELTLYIIQMQKKIDEIRKKDEGLEKELKHLQHSGTF